MGPTTGWGSHKCKFMFCVTHLYSAQHLLRSLSLSLCSTSVLSGVVSLAVRSHNCFSVSLCSTYLCSSPSNNCWSLSQPVMAAPLPLTELSLLPPAVPPPPQGPTPPPASQAATRQKQPQKTRKQRGLRRGLTAARGAGIRSCRCVAVSASINWSKFVGATTLIPVGDLAPAAGAPPP